MSGRRGQKIVMLRGPTSPEAFCGMLLEHADKIEHIACVVQWKADADGDPTSHTQVFSTRMALGDAVWLSYVFNAEFPDDGA